MSETTSRNLSGVPETLLITLYIRAMESQRPDALIENEQAVTLVRQTDFDLARIKQIKMDEDDKVAVILRTRNSIATPAILSRAIQGRRWCMSVAV